MPKLKPPQEAIVSERQETDHFDRKLLETLIKEPRATVERLSEELRLSTSAVQKRLSDLIQTKRVERMIAVLDWTSAGFPLRYRVDVRVNMRELRAGKGGLPEDDQRVDSQKKLAGYIKDVLPKQFRGRLHIQDVVILLGQTADLSITLRVKDSKTIFDFVTEGLRMLGGVESSMTSQESWSYGEPETDISF